MHLMKILLVEDDKLLNHHLTTLLTEAQNQVHSTDSAQVALHYAADYPIDVGIIDLGLPDMDGLQLISRLREQQIPFPIIVLTARGNWQDKVEGLEAGADDYLVKPFDVDELDARLRALLRRAAGRASPTIRYGDIEVDPAARTVVQGGKPVEMSPREFSVLLVLLQARGRVLSRQQLEERLYSWQSAIESNAVEVHIHHLRRKLGSGCIQTMRGVGYFMPQETT